MAAYEARNATACINVDQCIAPLSERACWYSTNTCTGKPVYSQTHCSSIGHRNNHLETLLTIAFFQNRRHVSIPSDPLMVIEDSGTSNIQFQEGTGQIRWLLVARKLTLCPMFSTKVRRPVLLDARVSFELIWSSGFNWMFESDTYPVYEGMRRSKRLVLPQASSFSGTTRLDSMCT